MAKNNKKSYGNIDIAPSAVADIATNATLECYGVVGLSNFNSIKDNVDSLLGRNDVNRGIVCTKSKQGYEVSVYIVVANDIKITEIAFEVQKKVRYVLEQTFGKIFDNINVYVQGIKKVN